MSRANRLKRLGLSHLEERPDELQAELERQLQTSSSLSDQKFLQWVEKRLQQGLRVHPNLQQKYDRLLQKTRPPM